MQDALPSFLLGGFWLAVHLVHTDALCSVLSPCFPLDVAMLMTLQSPSHISALL